MNKNGVATVIGGVVPSMVIGAIAAAGLWWGGSTHNTFALDGLPPGIVHNYHFAEQHEGLMSAIPCYCGCYQLGHGSLLECYVRPEGGYEAHASGCGVCGWETDDVERLIDEGAEAATVRSFIDHKYQQYGRGTDTPAR